MGLCNKCMDKGISDNMTKNVQKFEKMLESYVYIKEYCAVANERAELDLDEDIYSLEYHRDDLVNIANKYNISIFRVADDSDIDELKEYVLYLENKLINELHYKLSFMYQYD